MAEYYPLIAKAIASLPNPTVETRHAIYERARTALVRQLRNMQPPAPESDITREANALDEAIARLETELAPPPPAPVEEPAPAPEVPVSTPKIEPSPFPQAQPVSSAPIISEPEFVAAESKINLPKPAAKPAEPVEPPAAEARIAEAARPIAPTLTEQRPSNLRMWILGGVALLLVSGVAATAIMLKPSAEDKVVKPVAAPEVKPSGKIIERVGGAAAPPPVTTITPAKPSNPANTQTQNTTTPAVAGSTIPVALRAALLVEAPEEPTKIKTYVGNVFWTTQTKQSTSGPISVMHGEVTVPEAKFKFSFNLQKNDDANFPASHMMDMRFAPESTSAIPAIKTARLPELRQEEAERGETLRGALVPITANAYLVGLSRIEGDQSRNIDLLNQRNWIDISFVAADGREAKITFEKGIPGDTALKDALK